MARIGIFACSNATQDLGCSSVSCSADLRRRKGAFERYKDDEKLDLIGIVSCSGCPTMTGHEKLLNRLRALTEFKVDVIHFTYCMDTLCPFKDEYKTLLEKNFPDIKVVVGTHEVPITQDQFRGEIKKLFCQPQFTMVDVIKGRKIE